MIIFVALMETGFGKNALKDCTRHKSCSLKHAVNFQPKGDE